MAEHVAVVGDDSLVLKMEFAAVAAHAEIEHFVSELASVTEFLAKGNAPQRTGNLFRNITHTQAHEVAPGVFRAEVGVQRGAPYGRYVEEGTGIYGPKHVPIKPRTGNFLVFNVGGRTVFTKQVKGQPGKFYMKRAYLELKGSYLPARSKQLAIAIGNLG